MWKFIHMWEWNRLKCCMITDRPCVNVLKQMWSPSDMTSTSWHIYIALYGEFWSKLLRIKHNGYITCYQRQWEVCTTGNRPELFSEGYLANQCTPACCWESLQSWRCILDNNNNNNNNNNNRKHQCIKKYISSCTYFCLLSVSCTLVDSAYFFCKPCILSKVGNHIACSTLNKLG